MTIRLTTGDSATAHVGVPGGSGVTVPRHVAKILLAELDNDTDELSRLSYVYPKTFLALTKAGWLKDKVIHRSPPEPPHLKRLQIESLLTCNLSCSYCYSTSGPRRKEKLSHEEVINIIDQADDMAVQQIDFTGGEYLMTPGWRDQIAYARELGMVVTVHTNGTLLTEPAVQFLRKTSVAYVQVSVDSHLENIHDSARGHKNALGRTLSGLDRLHEFGVDSRISIMAHQGNISTLGSSIEFFSNRYPGFVINVDRVVGTTNSATDYSVSNKVFWEFVSPYLGQRTVSSKICGTESRPDIYEPDCGIYYSYLYITAEGEIAACPTMTSREERKFAGPNIRNISLKEAWYHHPKIAGMRHTNCSNIDACPAGRVCGGGCRSNAYNDTGMLEGPDYIACNMHKNSGRTFIDFRALYGRL